MAFITHKIKVDVYLPFGLFMIMFKYITESLFIHSSEIHIFPGQLK
jgi:hypothetical protein